MGGSGVSYNVRRLLLDEAASGDLAEFKMYSLISMAVFLILWLMWNKWRCRRDGLSPVTAAATTGMENRDLRRIPVAEYREGAGIAEECTICLADFAEGERVRVLPGCMHRFHVVCIDRWLMLHSSCPNCRHSVLEDKSAPPNAAGGGGGRRPDVESGGGGS